jgi:hypothetical protein
MKKITTFNAEKDAISDIDKFFLLLDSAIRRPGLSSTLKKVKYV